MRVICDNIFQIQNQLITKLLIPLYKHSIDRYYLNILMIFAIIYHTSVEFELYNLAYGNIQSGIYEQTFLWLTISKWKDCY